ncbi:unnamed protein product [Cyclocybe aegerita]|uniref:Uncharacterized protein n=1 Tax=Cyclocybe aegerita TaxID=1973307 RepID=A0A8S0W743_CYCAE|nr:unnamed protein product [Cyclocybe aegerita]
MAFSPIGLQSLPVKLLYEVELYSLSKNLPLVSSHFYDVYKNAPLFFHTQYILGRVMTSADLDLSKVYTRALHYPLCHLRVLEIIHGLLNDRCPSKLHVQLPRRLFRLLVQPQTGWSNQDEPIPLLQYLYHTPNMPLIYTNANNGYALTRAVHAKFLPLVQFLLDHRASPTCHEGLVLKVAIRHNSVDMFKMLVEQHPGSKQRGKKRKLEDRVLLDSNVLKVAVMLDA